MGHLRSLPFDILRLGLSFWGDPSFRQQAFNAVCEAMNRLADRTPMQPGCNVVWVLCGFSMGATIGLEFLHEFFSSPELYQVCSCSCTFMIHVSSLLRNNQLLPIESNLKLSNHVSRLSRLPSCRRTTRQRWLY